MESSQKLVPWFKNTLYVLLATGGGGSPRSHTQRGFSTSRCVLFKKKKTSIGRNCGLSTHLRKEVTLIRTRWDFLCPYWFCVFQLSLTLPSWVPLGHVFEALCVVISARCHPGPGLFPFLTSSAPLGTDFGECLPLPAPLTPARICACHVISSSSFFQPSICLIFF